MLRKILTFLYPHSRILLKHFTPFYIQTDGIISKLLGMDTSRYFYFLSILRENIDKGTIKEFLSNNFKKPNEEILF